MFLDFLCFDVVDQITNEIDVVATEDAAKDTNEDENQGLQWVGCMKISKANRGDDRNSEIVTVHVCLIPRQVVDPLLTHPGRPIPFKLSSRDQKNRDEMANHQITKKDLDQVPVFLDV